VGILVEQHAWCVVIETCSGNPPSGHLFGVIRRMEVVDVDVLGKRDEAVVERMYARSHSPSVTSRR